MVASVPGRGFKLRGGVQSQGLCASSKVPALMHVRRNCSRQAQFVAVIEIVATNILESNRVSEANSFSYLVSHERAVGGGNFKFWWRASSTELLSDLTSLGKDK